MASTGQTRPTDEDLERLRALADTKAGPLEWASLHRAIAYIESLPDKPGTTGLNWVEFPESLPDKDEEALDPDPHGGNPYHRYSPAPDVEGGMEPDRLGSWVRFDPDKDEES